MSVEGRAVIRRHAELGPGAVRGLAAVLDALGGGPVALLGSRSLDADQRGRLEHAAGRAFTVALTSPPELDRPALTDLRKELSATGPAILVACGGGTVMDAGKALAKPDGMPLVLLPKTLSGSEHTPNTARWEQGHKQVEVVGLADAVLGDPDLVVDDLALLGPGALHAIAHVLATLRDPQAGVFPPAIVRAGLADLVVALENADTGPVGRMRFLRGAWMAAVGFALTGPRIGAHHLIVHASAGPGDHARLSARLLCATLLRTDVYQDALATCAPGLPGIAARLQRLAEHWLGKVAHVQPKGVPESVPDALTSDVRRLLAALGMEAGDG